MLRLRLGCWYSGTSREASDRSNRRRAGQERSETADPIRLSLKARMLIGDGLRDEAGSQSIKDGYLVDPASSHMLVSKIKPCMSKYKLLYTVKLRMAH